MTVWVWSEMDDAILRLRYENKVSPKLIALELNRSRDAVMNRATSRKLATHQRPLRSQTIPKGELRLAEIARIASRYFGLSHEELMSKARTWRISHPRQIIMAMACEFTNLSLPAIGAFFGVDHTSVLHARNRMASLREDQPKMGAHFTAVRKLIMAAIASRVAARMCEVAWDEFETASVAKSPLTK